MDYSLTGPGSDPMRQQALMAELLRRRQAQPQQPVQQPGSELLQDASNQASALDPLAAIAHMANNPELAQAAQAAQLAQHKRFAPEKMGQQGFMLPSTGQFIESPIYADEKQAARDAVSENNLARLQAQREAQQERLAMQESLRQQGLQLTKAIADASNATRRHEGDANRALRLQLTDGILEQRRMLAEQVMANKEEQQTNKQVQQLDVVANKRAIPRLMTAGKTVADAIMLAEKSKKPVPGLSVADKLKSQYLPFLTDDDAARNISAVQEITNALLKADSGLSVTQMEQARKATEQMQSDQIPESRKRQILKERILPLLNTYRATALGAFPAHVRARYSAQQQEVGGDTSWMDQPLPFTSYSPEVSAGEEIVSKRPAK